MKTHVLFLIAAAYCILADYTIRGPDDGEFLVQGFILNTPVV